ERAKLDNFSSNPNKSKVCTSLCIPLLLAPNLPLLLARQQDSKNEANVNVFDKSDPSKNLDALHIQNFFSAITSGEKLHADINSGHKSTLLVQLGNIAQRTGRTLNIDPKSGHILNDKDALKLWSRKYENGWEMKL
ncbi:MAG: hypothetical protein PF904_09080, partial [Kiritimatiellae bacterium]|nr:hypothetical protein [Kiritimatiellia bacterium]